jgi:hypothetical protein
MACALPEVIAAAAPCNAYNQGYFSTYDIMMGRLKGVSEQVNAEEAEPTPVRVEADKKKEVYDYRVPVFQVSGLMDGKWPIEDPNDERMDTFNYWKKYNNIPTESFVYNSAYESGLTSDETFYDGDDQRFLHHRWYSRDEGNPSLYELFLAKRMPHAVDLRTFEYAWEFMKKFSRNPDGSLNISE